MELDAGVIIPEEGGVQTKEEGTLLLRGIGGDEGFTIEMLPFILISKKNMKKSCKIVTFYGC